MENTGSTFDMIEKDRLCLNEETGDCEKICNIIITNVSYVPSNNRLDKRSYFDDKVEDNVYEGFITNEAPVKSFIKRNNGNVHTIFFIASEKARKDSITDESGGKVSSLCFLKRKINEYCDKNYRKPNFCVVQISDEPDAKEVAETVQVIYNSILELSQCENVSEINLFVESNGGVRYLIPMVLSITKSLEKYDDRIHIRETSSMVSGNDNNKIRIFNSKSIFDAAEITGLVDEYLYYGRTDGLRKYIENQLRSENKELTNCSGLQSLLGKMEKTANDIQLCRTSSMLEDFFGSGNIVSSINEYLNEGDGENSPSFSGLPTLTCILKIMLKELVQFTVKQNDPKVSKNLHLPVLISWCLKKSFLQQALTLCSEQLPQFLFDSELIKKGELLSNVKIDTKNYTEGYYFFANQQEYIEEIIHTVNAEEIPKYKAFVDCYKRFCGGSEKEWKETLIKCIGQENENTIIIVFKNKKTKKITRSTICEVLHGRVLKDDGKYGLHCELVKKDGEPNADKIIQQVTPRIIEIMNYKFTTKESECNKKKFAAVFGFLDESLKQSLINAYQEKLSDKYAISKLVQNKDIVIKEGLREETIQKILYLYAVCKEQRNLSNHAASAQEGQIEMSAASIRVLIDNLLELISSCQE